MDQPREIADYGLRPLFDALVDADAPPATWRGEAHLLDHWAAHAPETLGRLRTLLERGHSVHFDSYGRFGAGGLELALRQLRSAAAARHRHLGDFAARLDANTPSLREAVAAQPFDLGEARRGDGGDRALLRTEAALLAVEFLSAFAPAEVDATLLDEAWRRLLVASPPAEAPESARGWLARVDLEAAWTLVTRLGTELRDAWAHSVGRSEVAFNPLGWDREIPIVDDETGEAFAVGPVPAFGYLDLDDLPPESHSRPIAETEIYRDEDEVTLVRGPFQVVIHARRGEIVQIIGDEFRRGCLSPGAPLFPVFRVDGHPQPLDGKLRVSVDEDRGTVTIESKDSPSGHRLRMNVALAPLIDAVDISVELDRAESPSEHYDASWRLPVRFAFPPSELRADRPGAVGPVPDARYFGAASFVDAREEASGVGVLLLHDGSPHFERQDHGYDVILWSTPEDDLDGAELDETNDSPDPLFPPRFRLIPHARWRDHESVRRSAEFADPLESALPCFEERVLDLTSQLGLENPHRTGPAAASCASFYGNAEVVLTAVGRSELGELEIRLVDYSGEGAAGTVRVVGAFDEAYLSSDDGRPRKKAPHRVIDKPEHTEVEVRLEPGAVATVTLVAR